MKVEAPNFKIVDNEPGWGSFHTVLKWITNGKIVSDDVPALDFGRSNRPDKEYISRLFATGMPFLAWRYGERGICGVLLNPNVKNAQVHQIYTLNDDLTSYYEKDIDPSEFMTKPGWTDATWWMPDQRMEISGDLNGRRFVAIIYYIPSTITDKIDPYRKFATQRRFGRPMDIDKL